MFSSIEILKKVISVYPIVFPYKKKGKWQYAVYRALVCPVNFGLPCIGDGSRHGSPYGYEKLHLFQELVNSWYKTTILFFIYRAVRYLEFKFLLSTKNAIKCMLPIRL